MDTALLNRIQHVYDHRPLADVLETRYKRLREKCRGIDTRIFDKTIRYYQETRGQTVSPAEALQRALNKERHKQAWFTRDRHNVQEIMAFYQEIDVYPFRQPYVHRLRPYRWYIRLVDHIPQPSILEYGCGSAVLTEKLLATLPQCTYTVADIPSVTLEFVRWKKTAYKYPYHILTIGPGQAGIPLRQPYDLIICQDVLEHTPNPLDIVTAFVQHLSPGGVLVIDFINAPGGENLALAVAQREAVKCYLKAHLIVLKAIDEPGGNNGLYVQDGM
jgi:2-polyprenyl-3-methyl-5-hydroxy-6-metoxy-1,4-benzoquinol methylase